MLPRIVLLLALISAAHAQLPGYKYSWVPNPLGGFPEWKQVPVDPPATAGITLKSTDPFTLNKTTIGSSDIININPGPGVLVFMSSDGHELSLQFAIDTAVIPAGPQGPPGKDGAPGPPGPGGTGAALPPGKNAGDILTWDGAKWVASFNQGIPLYVDGTRNADGSFTCAIPPSLLTTYPNWRMDVWGIKVFLNGMRQKTSDFNYPPATLAAGTALKIVFPKAPAVDSSVICDYRVQ